MTDIFSGAFRRRLPVMLQIESAECGLACLAMIASYFGRELDLPAVRRRFPTSSRGATLSRVIANAYALGFNSRPLRVDLEYLPRLQTPCILHWNLNHFVVLKRVTATRVEIHDPASGFRSLSVSDFGKHFTGIALELQPNSEFVREKEQQPISLRALAGDLRGLGSSILQVLMLAVGLEVLALTIPLYLQTVLDQVIVTNDSRLMTLLGIAFLVVVTLRAGTVAARGWAISWIGGRLNAQWVANLFAHMLRLPMSYFERRHTGDLTSRFLSVQTVQQTLTGSFVETILDGLMSIAVFLVLSFYSLRLTAVLMAAFTLYIACRWLAYRRLWRASEEQIVYAARQQTALLEAIRGVQTIKLANKQSDRAARFAAVTMQSVQRNVVVQRIGFAFASVSQWLFSAQRVVVVWIAASQVLAGNFSVGMLVAFVTYADELTTRLGGLIDKLVEFRLLRLHANRIADIALTEPEDLGVVCRSELDVDADIEVDNISFRYSEGEPWILKNFSMHIAAGESVAITGPSGCGKTTLAKLILGLIEPVEGVIRIGGVGIRQHGIGAYRDMVGAVMQDDELFEGSIADNISFFDEESTLGRIEAAAGHAMIHDEIAAMPMGYETLIGDMGSSLSGGQKQRLLLARAIYRKPKILVLDEATSHLDAERESIINEWTKRMKATRIIIAHRRETIDSADRIVPILTRSRKASIAEMSI